jgi:hypothetical protein
MRRSAHEPRNLETAEGETPEFAADAGEAPKRKALERRAPEREPPERDPSEPDAATRSLRRTLRRTAEPPRVGGKRGARMRHRNRQG